MHSRKKKPRCSIIISSLVLLMTAIVSDTTDRTGVSQATTEDTTDKFGNWQVVHDETVDQSENVPETKNNTFGVTESLETTDDGTVDTSRNSQANLRYRNTTDKSEGFDFNDNDTLDRSGNLQVTTECVSDKVGHFQVNNTSAVETLQEADINTVDKAENLQEADVNSSDKARYLQEADVNSSDKARYLQEADVNSSDKARYLQEADVNSSDKAKYLQEADVNSSDKARYLQEANINTLDKDRYLQENNTTEFVSLHETDDDTWNKPGKLQGSDILDGSEESTTDPPSDSNSLLNRIVTCKGKCGQVIGNMCSCDKRCVVYRNCCEGMADDCPQIWEESHRKYSSSLNFQIGCSVNGYFMIDSCMKLSVDESGDDKDSTAEVETSFGRNLGFATRNFEIPPGDFEIGDSELTHALTNTVVTDAQDGITYASPEVYFCIHDRNTSKTLVPWDVYYSLTNLKQPSDLADLEGSINILTTEFRPPPTVSLFARRCIPQALTTCENVAVLQTNPDLQRKCKSFTSYVQTATSSQTTFYNNRFCFQCSKNRHGDFIPTLRPTIQNQVYDFSVVISRVSGNKVTLYARQSLLVQGYPLPWKWASCNLSELYNIPGVYEEETKQFEKTSCSIECYPNFEKKRDGKCKMLHIMEIGIAEDGYPLTSLEKRQWPFFLGCILEKHFSLEIGNIGMQSLSVYDRTLGRTLYTSNIAIFLPVLDPMHSLKLREDGWSMALVFSVKAFKDYRQRNLLLVNNGNIELSDNRTSGVEIETYNISTTFPNFHDYERGPLLDNTVTTVCLEASTNSLLGCWEDPLYENDTLQLIELRQSSCFDHLHVKKQDSGDGNNDAATFLGGQTFIKLFCVGLLGIILIA